MTAPTGVITLIPVNRLDRAKGRLESLLSAEERAELARITTRTVVGAATAIGPVAILTADPEVRRLFHDSTRLIDEDPSLRGLNAQLEGALDRLDGFGSVLILHADLPLASAAAIQSVVDAAEESVVPIVRPPDGGTNAMVINSRRRFSLAYGKGSCARHTEAAESQDLTVTRVPSPDLEVDLDTPEDVAALLSQDRGRACEAGRYLLALGVDQRLRDRG